MFTDDTSKPDPGTLAPILSETPSSGWMRITSTFGSSVRVPANGVWGVFLNWMAISVAFFGSRLPDRR